MKKRATTPRGKRATTPEGLPPRETAAVGAVDSRRTAVSTPSLDLRRAVHRWLADGKAQGWSSKTVKDREQAMARFCWWLEHEEETAATLGALTPLRIRAFLTYAREPHPTGRYSCDRPSARREGRPATVHAYFRVLRALSNFCMAEGLLEQTPLKNVKAPRVPVDQVQPFSPNQVQALIDAARRTRTPERDVAIILLLVDTGMRVSELCGLKVRDVDRGTGELVVVGKGNKRRRVYMGAAARRALWRYLETDRREALADEPVFVAGARFYAGAGLTTSGVLQMIHKARKSLRFSSGGRTI